jgi:hypothetical protein
LEWPPDRLFWFGLVFSVCQAPSYLCLEQIVAVGMTTWSSVLVWFGFFRVPGTFISVPGANGGSCRNDHLIIYCGFLLVGGNLPSYLFVSLLHHHRNLLMNVWQNSDWSFWDLL